jgi:hypothetical protein
MNVVPEAAGLSIRRICVLRLNRPEQRNALSDDSSPISAPSWKQPEPIRARL